MALSSRRSRAFLGLARTPNSSAADRAGKATLIVVYLKYTRG